MSAAPQPEGRSPVQDRARRAVAEGRPLAWFEDLYREARDGGAEVPWAEGAPNPTLVAFLGRLPFLVPTGRALVVGCGLGDDAEWLAARGWSVSAFDVAPTAIEGCRLRFPASPVSYRVADLFAPPPGWPGAFDLVLESYTVQALPPVLRERAIAACAALVAPGGHLLLIAQGRLPEEEIAGPPWPLTRAEAGLFVAAGLEEVRFDELLDGEEPPTRRFAGCYRRP